MTVSNSKSDWRDHTNWNRVGDGRIMCTNCNSEVFGGICDCYEEPLSKPTGLDEAVRMFKGYVLGENGFDELDFKEWLLEWHEQEIAKARRNELLGVMNYIAEFGDNNIWEKIVQRRAELSQTLKEGESSCKG